VEKPRKEARVEFCNHIVHYIRMSPKDFLNSDNRHKQVFPNLEYAPMVECTVLGV